MLIKNFDDLAISEGRKVVLQIVEAGLAAIQPQFVMSQNLSLSNNILEVVGQKFDLNNFQRAFLVALGKGSASIARIIEEKLGEKLTGGWVVDLISVKFSKIKFTVGTHPLPSEQNVEFTKNVVKEMEGKLSAKDLVLVVTCGGGSAMLTYPQGLSVEQIKQVNQALLRSGATIAEMNTVRKKLDRVKGGGLAAILYPATVVSLIFSDVPGNDLATIASGPTVKDPTTMDEAKSIIQKYDLSQSLSKEDLTETPKEEKLFENVHNILTLSNLTAIQAMGRKGQELGYQVTVQSDRLQGEAREVGTGLIKLISELGPHQVIIAGGETTVVVKGNGKGGRNQELVMGALMEMSETSGGRTSEEGTVEEAGHFEISSGRKMVVSKKELPSMAGEIVVAAFDSDGQDNSGLAGAIGDLHTLEKARSLNLEVKSYLDDNNALEFWEKVGDGIETGKLPSNVSDLMVVLKN